MAKSKASAWADQIAEVRDSKPENLVVGKDTEEWLVANVTDDGEAYINKNGIVMHLPDRLLLPLARWILDTFSAFNETP